MRILSEYDIRTHPRYRRFASPNPLGIANCVCWLRAEKDLFQDSAFTTPADDADEPIGGWKDQSGSGNHFISSGTSRPLLKMATVGGYSSAKFDGSNDYLMRGAALVSHTAGTMFVATNCPSASTHGALMGVGSNANGWKVGVGGSTFDNAGNDVIGLFDAVRWIGSNQQYGTGDKVVSIQKPSIGALKVWVNASLLLNNSGTSAKSPSALTYMGSGVQTNRYIPWYVAELVIYNRNLTQDEIDTIEEYLALKFGVTLS